MDPLSVPMKYKFKSLIGNWNEEQQLEEHNMRDYLKKKDQNALESSKTEKKFNHSLQKVQISGSQDGYLSYDSIIMLQSQKTKGYLSVNIWDKVQGSNDSFYVSTKLDDTAHIRSAFRIVKYEAKADNIVRYGEKIQISGHPHLLPNDVFNISSCPISHSSEARFSKQMEITLTSQNSYKNVFQIQHIDPKMRLQMNGSPILVNDPVLIQHSYSSQFLANDFVSYLNDFGTEYEVFCKSFLSLGKSQNLKQEKDGHTTVDTSLRNNLQENFWKFIVNNEPKQNLEGINYHAQSLISILKQNIIKKGIYAMNQLEKTFHQMYKKQYLSEQEFHNVLINYGMPISMNESACIFQNLAKENQLNIDDFFNRIRGQLSQCRENLISKAYDKVKLLTGKQLDKMFAILSVKKDPEVERRIKTEQEALQDFIQNWGDKSLGYHNFRHFYNNISVAIDRDDLFTYLVTFTWGL